ncbi:MAG: hypothetical protein JSW72_08195 [Candidatus Bathyarchaeota archaeon]|nr:MAG: hypothetical protein JSW72_08195 [Candidatus Bathyarchaeota archaeon]
MPEDAILGTVVIVLPREPDSAPTEPSSEEKLSDRFSSEPSFPLLSGTFIVGTGVICLGVAMAVLLTHTREVQKNKLKSVNVYTCYTWGYYETEYVRRVELTDGRIKLLKISDDSRGFCRYFNEAITDFPRTDCRAYKTAADWGHKKWLKLSSPLAEGRKSSAFLNI